MTQIAAVGEHHRMYATDQDNLAMEFANVLAAGETLSSVVSSALTYYASGLAASSELTKASLAVGSVTTQITFQLTSTAAPVGNKYLLFIQTSTNLRTAGPSGELVIDIIQAK